MLFRRRRTHEAAPPEVRKRALSGGMPELVFIGFDMLVKGNITKRGRNTIRQYCVTVDGASRLVTSGDTVDRKTWKALVDAGAVRLPRPTEETLEDHPRTERDTDHPERPSLKE